MRVRGALPIALVLLLVCVGTSQAYFAGANGSGRGVAPVAAAQPVVIAPAGIAAGLHPGGTAPLSVVATNPNPFPVRIASLRLDPATPIASDAPGCSPTAVSMPTQTNGGVGWTVPAAGSLAIGIPGAVAMGAAADSACQGAAFTLPLTAGT